MTNRTIFGFMVCTSALVGCGNPGTSQNKTSNKVAAVTHRSDDDKAAETLNQMLELGTKSDWKTVVERYYGEQQKFRSSADRDALVRRFQQQWGEKFVQGLRRAAKFPPRIEGEKAVFLDGDEPVFILHRDEDGSWKFHL